MEKLQELPVIDLSSILGSYENTDDVAMDQIAEEFGTTMSKIGFAYVINHGIDLNKVDHIHKLSKDFFFLPESVKHKYKKQNPTKDYHGYDGPGDRRLNETIKDPLERRECWDIWGTSAHDPKNFPQEIPGYKLAFDEIRSDCNNLGKKLLRCLGKYLRLEDEHFFVNHHRNFDDPINIRSQTQFRTLHYFEIDPDDKSISPDTLRCAEHSDWGTITLLFQDMIGGLEVKRADGTWIDAAPIKDSILINTAQLLEIWSGGIFPATPHRVRITKEERLIKSARQSLIYFINPDGDTEITPVVPIQPGKKELVGRKSVNAYDHYITLIENS